MLPLLKDKNCVFILYGGKYGTNMTLNIVNVNLKHLCGAYN